jgi:hypothetical protein
MPLPDCSEEVVTFAEEVRGRQYVQIERALEEVWGATASMPPEFMVMDRRTGEMFTVVSEQERCRREVCTPLGLKRMFPGLR